MSKSSVKVPSVKVSVALDRLNRDGYTASGRYFGVGAPIYRVTSEDGVIDTHLRANNREGAKEQVREIAIRRDMTISFYR